MSGCGCFYRMEDSMETEREGKNAAITVIRWSARVLWVISMGVLLPFFLGEGTPGNSMGPLAAISFGLLGIYGYLDAQELALLTRWVDLNRDALIKYWDGEIESTSDVLGVLKPIAAL